MRSMQMLSAERPQNLIDAYFALTVVSSQVLSTCAKQTPKIVHNKAVRPAD
jgi:hypothetical protein